VQPALAHPDTLSRETPQRGVDAGYRADCEGFSGSGAASRQLQAPSLLRLWHLASLDAPTVAVVWALAFAWAAKVRLPLWIPVLLALAAWVVYVVDRLLDARAALSASQLHRLRQRHRFHWRHRSILIPLAIAAAGAAASIVLILMPAGARERNSVLATAAFAYFTRVHSSRKPSKFPFPLLPKELLVGMLFTAACALPALSRAAVEPCSSLWLLIGLALFFATLAWLNCHAIERWEVRGPSSRNLQVLPAACLLTLTGLLFAILLAPNHFRLAALVATGAASALLLALLDRCRHRLTPIALRAAADIALLTPLILLLR
jgi:hypothetical protein